MPPDPFIVFLIFQSASIKFFRTKKAIKKDVKIMPPPLFKISHYATELKYNEVLMYCSTAGVHQLLFLYGYLCRKNKVFSKPL